MGGCFGKQDDTNSPELKQVQPQQQRPNKQREISKNDQTVIELLKVRDDLRDKQLQIEAQIDAIENNIKKLILGENKKRDRAKFEFEKKKLYQKYLENVDNKQIVMDKMILEVKQAQMDKDCTDVLKNANGFLKDVQETINLEKMQDIFCDINQNERDKEQYNQMFKDYAVGEDDQQLEQEYNQIEAQMLQQQIQTHDINPIIDQNLIQEKQKQDNQVQQQQQHNQQKEQKQQQQQQNNNNKNEQKHEELDDLLA